MNEAYESGRNGGQIADDLRTLVKEAEALLRTTANAGSEQLPERAHATLAEMRRRLNDLERLAKARAHDVDTYVHDNPWQAVAAAGGVALLLGILMGRR
jgi:ElaB/YqjD/DUF883 family membrane-anchored ribosome-binding protein